MIRKKLRGGRFSPSILRRGEAKELEGYSSDEIRQAQRLRVSIQFSAMAGLTSESHIQYEGPCMLSCTSACLLHESIHM